MKENCLFCGSKTSLITAMERIAGVEIKTVENEQQGVLGLLYGMRVIEDIELPPNVAELRDETGRVIERYAL